MFTSYGLSRRSSCALSLRVDQGSTGAKLVQQEKRETGTVAWRVLQAYLDAFGGSGVAVFFTVLLLLAQVDARVCRCSNIVIFIHCVRSFLPNQCIHTILVYFLAPPLCLLLIAVLSLCAFSAFSSFLRMFFCQKKELNCP